eukprot:TRINITY_DN20018_c0_g1_i2.p1 TRINITY_DN20018_c0_g1~~TRINITY_DN20018_c0_g1_i2.p1  ORF type:complete len:1031 (+),score=334.73 TRINITY_DN20018_c0_g1_i2:73-3165(+)
MRAAAAALLAACCGAQAPPPPSDPGPAAGAEAVLPAPPSRPGPSPRPAPTPGPAPADRPPGPAQAPPPAAHHHAEHHRHSEHINRDQRRPTLFIAVPLSIFILWLYLRQQSPQAVDNLFRRIAGIGAAPSLDQYDAEARASLAALERLPRGGGRGDWPEDLQPAAELVQAATPDPEAPPPEPLEAAPVEAARAESPAPYQSARVLRPSQAAPPQPRPVVPPWRVAAEAAAQRERRVQEAARLCAAESDHRSELRSEERGERAPLQVQLRIRAALFAAFDAERQGRRAVAQDEAAARGSAQAVEAEWRCGILEREEEFRGAAEAEERSRALLAEEQAARAPFEVLAASEIAQLARLVALSEEDERQACLHEEGLARAALVEARARGVSAARAAGQARRRLAAGERERREALRLAECAARDTSERAALAGLRTALPQALQAAESRARSAAAAAEALQRCGLSESSQRLCLAAAERRGRADAEAAARGAAPLAAGAWEGRARREVRGAEAEARARLQSRHNAAAARHAVQLAEVRMRTLIAGLEGDDRGELSARCSEGALELAAAAERAAVSRSELRERVELQRHSAGLGLRASLAALAAAEQRARDGVAANEGRAAALAAALWAGGARGALEAEESRERGQGTASEAEQRAALLGSSAPQLAASALHGSEQEGRADLERMQCREVAELQRREQGEHREGLEGAEAAARAALLALESAQGASLRAEAYAASGAAAARSLVSAEDRVRGELLGRESAARGALAAAEAQERLGPLLSDEAAGRGAVVQQEQGDFRELGEQRVRGAAAAGAPPPPAEAGPEAAEAHARADLECNEAARRSRLAIPMVAVIDGVQLRERRSIQSRPCGKLRRGDSVAVAELRGLRGRVLDGGWVSVMSQHGQHILRAADHATDSPPPTPAEAADEALVWEVTATKESEEKLGLLFDPDEHGIIVKEVRPGSAAERNGLSDRVGQRLTHVNGEAVRSLQDFAPFAKEERLQLRFAPPQSAFAAAAQRAALGAGGIMRKGLGGLRKLTT